MYIYIYIHLSISPSPHLSISPSLHPSTHPCIHVHIIYHDDQQPSSVNWHLQKHLSPRHQDMPGGLHRFGFFPSLVAARITRKTAESMIKYQNKSEHELWMLWWKRHIFVSRRIHQKIDQLRKPVWILTAVLRNCGALKEWTCISGINFTNMSKKSNKHPTIKKVCQCRKPTNCYIYQNEEHQQTITNGYNMYSNPVGRQLNNLHLLAWSHLHDIWQHTLESTYSMRSKVSSLVLFRAASGSAAAKYFSAMARLKQPRSLGCFSLVGNGGNSICICIMHICTYIYICIYIYTHIHLCVGGNPVSHIFIHGSWWYTMIY